MESLQYNKCFFISTYILDKGGCKANDNGANFFMHSTIPVSILIYCVISIQKHSVPLDIHRAS